jgi:2',3'-cyclic-nucleotide 2'-phosphodiesterase (5'-nucleotidase family)
MVKVKDVFFLAICMQLNKAFDLTIIHTNDLHSYFTEFGSRYNYYHK